MRKKSFLRLVRTQPPGSVDIPPDGSGAPAETARVLVVDDNPRLLEAHRRMIAAIGVEVTAVTSARSAMELLAHGKRVDVIVTDIVMPNMDGVAMLREIRKYDLDVPVVLVTGYPSLATAMEAMRYGGLRYLTKPVKDEQLQQVVREAIQLHRLARLKREALQLAEAHHAELGDRASLEVHFERAMEHARVAFQPVVDWRARSLFGYEAFVRSREPTLSSPQLLFGAAERLGRVQALGRWIRDLVAAAMPGAPPEAMVFVNLHPAELEDDALSDPAAALSAFSSRVVFDITERNSLDGLEDVQERVATLRELGFRIAMDDLGAGYAGLASLGRLEPDVVKLDASLVRGVDQSTRKQSLLRSIVHVCERQLGMYVVCEGVEQEAERDALVSLGANLLQGYLFGRPRAEFHPPRWLEREQPG
ncbi:MAG: EAL domain-containing protein [Polyangiaceae bacterium]|nr:EAL domain-containing protein [Polyangiaceae bacterium]